MKLATRLTIAVSLLTAVCVVLSSGITGWFAQRDTSEALANSLEERFQTVVASRRASLEQLVQNDSQLLRSLANTRMTQEAVWGFRNPYSSYRYEVPSIATDALRDELLEWYRTSYQELYARRSGGQNVPMEQWLDAMSHEALLLQKYYMADSIYGAAALEKLDDPSDGTIYGQRHAMIHTSYLDIMQRFGFSDFLLVDASTLAVTFSTAKGPLFATSLRSGPFSQSGLAQIVAQLEKAPERGVVLSAFEQSAFRFDELTAYMAAPIFHWSQSPDMPVGYLVATVPASHWAEQLNARAARGSVANEATQETYLVDQEGRLLSEILGQGNGVTELVGALREEGVPESRLRRVQNTGKTAGHLQLGTQAVESALAGNTGSDIQSDYIGREMFTAWTPLTLMGRRFAVVAQQEASQVQASLTQMRTNVWYSVVLGALVLTLLAAVAARFLAMVVSGPLQRMQLKIRQAGDESDLRVHFPIEREDELGDISRSLNGLFSVLTKTLSDISGATDNTAAQAQQNATRAQYARDSVAQQKAKIQQVGVSCDQVCRSLHDMATQLSDTDSQTQHANQLAQAGGKQMLETVKGIEHLSDQVANSFATLNELRAAADNVFTMLDTIKSVSEQTNLLALNAAIEAARAGEHGRGFAVVADEVRRLSASTRTAASDIEDQIQNLKSRVDEISIGLEFEQESAQRCVLESQSAHKSLEQISQQVSHVSAVMIELNRQSQQEYQRVNTMRDGLEQVVEVALTADETIYSLSQSAQDQLLQCDLAAQATRVLKCKN